MPRDTWRPVNFWEALAAFADLNLLETVEFCAGLFLCMAEIDANYA